MEEFFKAIEDKIRAAGYSGPLDGEALYNEICDEIEDKDNGSYLFLSKKDNGDVFEYKVWMRNSIFPMSTLPPKTVFSMQISISRGLISAV